VRDRPRFRPAAPGILGVSREVGEEVLNGASRFVETAPPGQPPRFVRMHAVEADYVGRDLTDPAFRRAVRDQILKVIEAYRAPASTGPEVTPSVSASRQSPLSALPRSWPRWTTRPVSGAARCRCSGLG
jgi:hypothetical protein